MIGGLSPVDSLSSAIQAIHIQVPVGIPTPDGGLEIPNRVFLGGVPVETSEMELEIFFSDFGIVKDVRIVTDRLTGDCKGYGFVTFEENEDVSELIKRKSVIMKGKKVRVRKAIRRNGSQFAQNNGTTAARVNTESRPKTIPSASSGSTENSYYLVPVTESVNPQQVPSSCYMQLNSQALTSPATVSTSSPPPMIPANCSSFPPPMMPSYGGPVYFYNPSVYAPYPPPIPQWPVFQA